MQDCYQNSYLWLKFLYESNASFGTKELVFEVILSDKNRSDFKVIKEASLIYADQNKQANTFMMNTLN